MEPIVKTHFVISGDALDFEEITCRLGVPPTETRRKAYFPEVSKALGLAHDSWIYSTPEQECRAVSVQLDALEAVLGNHVDELNQICEKFRADITVVIVIKMTAGNHPELVLRKENIDFLSSLHAEIGIDPYIDNADEE